MLLLLVVKCSKLLDKVRVRVCGLFIKPVPCVEVALIHSRPTHGECCGVVGMNVTVFDGTTLHICRRCKRIVSATLSSEIRLAREVK